MKSIKDWSESITGLEALDVEATLNLYSEMLATAHDLGYKVPDAQLIETEDPAQLKAVIPALHEGLIKFHAEAKAAVKEKAAKQAKADKAKPKPPKKKATVAKAASSSKNENAPTKPAKKVAQKETEKETEPMTATVKKTAKKAAAKKAPAKKAPAKKAAAKKAPAKKAAAKNARTPVARSPFPENAVIKVLNKENPARPDSERGKRIAAVFKFNGKKVSEFYKQPAPLNRTDTLRFLIDREFITVK